MIMSVVKRLPLPVARLAFRVYDKALRTLGSTHVATTYFGARLACAPADYIQRMILYFGVWEPNVSKVIEQNLAPGDVFVDVGAHIGYDTLLASLRVGPKGKVVAIEASPRTFDLLQDNLALNAFATNVRAVNAIVADRPGKLELYEADSTNIGAATTVASRGGALLGPVDALPLENILNVEERRRLRLIKIDVEGAEPPIVQHLLDRLSDYPASMDIVVEASPDDDPARWGALFDRLRAAGFNAWGIENDYELEWYLRWRYPAPLQRVESMPKRQQDFLFTRRSSPGHEAPSTSSPFASR
jgi:FkbM family methyltransferase